MKIEALEAPEPGCEAVERLRVEGDAARTTPDWVACEEPLEIQLGSESLAVVMRTPGHDRELALGLLFTERVIVSLEDISALYPYTRTRDPENEDNVLRVVTAPRVEVDFEALRRNLYSNSSCGVCGKATIESALATHPPLEDDSKFPASFFYALPARLRAAQTLFAKTGGLHGAGLFDRNGELLVVREDVGRHNAVDKVIGWALQNHRLPLSRTVLMVSGRVSYEIVQKALAARIPAIAAVSAPTSLAIRLADSSGIALVGFLRGSGLNAYANRARISG